jgi:hypothetical protein
MTDYQCDELEPEADDYAKPAGTTRPGEALRRTCLGCCNGSAYEVKNCPSRRCPLWLFRLGPKPTPEMLAEVRELRMYPLEGQTTIGEFHDSGGTRVRSIRYYCADCAGSRAEARKCKRVMCELHPFRNGNNPNRKMTPEQRENFAARLKANVRPRPQ